MAHKELESQEDFAAAFATKDRFVSIFAYEGQIPPPATENAKRFAATTDAYSLNVGKHDQAKGHFKIEKVPTLLVFKNGEEVKRVDDFSPENSKALEDLLLG